MKATLTILAEDIRQGNYMDSSNCPITKALHRAGYPDLRDSGIEIINNYDDAVCNRRTCPEYQALIDKVIGMTKKVRQDKGDTRFNDDPREAIEIADFTVELELNLE